MKIRNGFVSNSSTTSFCIYGTYMNTSNFRNYLKETDLFTEIKKEDFEEEDCDLIDAVCGKSKYLDSVFNEAAGGVYIGRSYFTLGDDETGGEFKQKTQEEFDRFFDKGKISLSLIMDSISS